MGKTNKPKKKQSDDVQEKFENYSQSDNQNQNHNIKKQGLGPNTNR